MNKLIATLTLALGISGAALADDGYFADQQGDFSQAPVSAAQAYDGMAPDWSFVPAAVPSANGAGFASVETEENRHAG